MCNSNKYGNIHLYGDLKAIRMLPDKDKKIIAQFILTAIKYSEMKTGEYLTGRPGNNTEDVLYCPYCRSTDEYPRNMKIVPCTDCEKEFINPKYKTMRKIEELNDIDLLECWSVIGGAPHLFEAGKEELRTVLVTGFGLDDQTIGLQLDYYTMAALVDVLRKRGFETIGNG